MITIYTRCFEKLHSRENFPDVLVKVLTFSLTSLHARTGNSVRVGGGLQPRLDGTSCSRLRRALGSERLRRQAQRNLAVGIGIGVEWRLDNRFSWINLDLDLDLDLDVDLDLHKQETG